MKTLSDFPRFHDFKLLDLELLPSPILQHSICSWIYLEPSQIAKSKEGFAVYTVLIPLLQIKQPPPEMLALAAIKSLILFDSLRDIQKNLFIAHRFKLRVPLLRIYLGQPLFLEAGWPYSLGMRLPLVLEALDFLYHSVLYLFLYQLLRSYKHSPSSQFL